MLILGSSRGLGFGILTFVWAAAGCGGGGPSVQPGGSGGAVGGSSTGGSGGAGGQGTAGAGQGGGGHGGSGTGGVGGGSPGGVPLTGVIALSAGGGFSCAVLSDGSVKCWGGASKGSLGNGPTTGFSPVPTPTAVAGLTGVSSISSNDGYTCVTVIGGNVECWGSTPPALGGAPSLLPSSSTPAVVAGLAGVTALSVDDNHLCALLTGGSVQCLGFNENGQLGNGTKTQSATPVTVTGLAGVTSITVGGSTSCGLLAGTVQCWGEIFDANPSPTPIAVPALTGVTAVSAGQAGFACALITGGAVQCWGLNYTGSLGNGTTTDSATPVPVTGLSTATAISAGPTSTCAVLTDGTVECWGMNDSIVGTTKTPTAVSGLTGVVGVSVGGNHACALLSGGTVKCWGENEGGALGDGTLVVRTAPVTVIGG